MAIEIQTKKPVIELGIPGPSGAKVQSDWNQNDETAPDYVKNRPFYTETTEVVLVEETTVPFAEKGGLYGVEFLSAIEATVGETYKVYWDGTAYECTCVDFDGNNMIGNLSIAGSSSNTGEPFVMQVVNGKGIIIVTKDTSASHTFSISRLVTEIVKIDEKYLPDNPLNITGSTVGQIAKISAVDDSGKPTAWEPVDIPSGGGEKPVVKIIDTEITGKTMKFEANNLQGVSTIVAIWSGIFNESGTDSGLDLQINDVAIASFGFIKNAKKDKKIYGYSVAKLVNGFWVCDIAQGAMSAGNLQATAPFFHVHSLVADVGTANKIVFSASIPMYAPITGRLEVWAR